jgi:hypothetical protein
VTLRFKLHKICTLFFLFTVNASKHAVIRSYYIELFFSLSLFFKTGRGCVLRKTKEEGKNKGMKGKERNQDLNNI